MKVCFYYSFRDQKDWNDSDLEKEGLPGSETAIVHISREMAKRHQVTVYNKTSREGIYHGVRYRNLQNFDYRNHWDVIMVVRGQPPRLEYVPAKLKLYWSIEEGSYLVKDWSKVLPYVKKVITISPFHTEELIRNTEVPREKIFQTRLGVNESEYQDTFPKVNNKLIYCSVPRKGLDNLAKIFPLVKREVPDASLVITSDYTLWGRKPQTDEYLKTFSKIPSVSFLGRINRKRLIYEQKTSQLHVYPCVFEELFCLSAMECQAAGTPCVCSDIGALSTTVKDGVTGKLVKMENGKVPVEEFAQEIINLLKNPVQLAKMSKAARERALQKYTYEKIVREWEESFKCWLQGK
jgi:glycosyltransferase involved in cell wall biosynthesis